MMKVDLDYCGEFGPELQTLIPYAYYLYKKDILGKTISSLDTKCFYYFSEQHEERYAQRKYVPPWNRMRRVLPNPDEHVSHFDISQFEPPPYK